MSFKFGFGFGFPFNGSLMGAVTSRYFTTLDGAADYFTMPTVTLAGAFEIEFDFSTTADLTALHCVTGSVADASNRILLTSSTNLQIRIAGGSLNFTVAAMDDGKLHKGKITRDGSDNVECFLDGVSSGIQVRAGSFVLGEIGHYFSGSFFDGVIAELKITDTGLIRYYKINEDWDGTTTLIDYGTDGSDGTAVSITTANAELFTMVGADWLGAELWTHGDVSAVAAASGFVGGVSVTAISGLRYKFAFDVANYSSGSTESFITASGTNRVANGSYTDLINATGTSAGWDVATNPTTLDVDNGSIQRILEAP